MEDDLRFGVSVRGWQSGQDLWEAARSAEAAGFDVLTVPDHLGAPAPFQALAVASCATERIRLRTYVLDVGFWNPALLAREVASLDRLSGGRVELGIGAGHMKHEHDDAKLPWEPIGRRWEQVEETVAVVRQRLADPEHRPEPVQRPVPVMVAAMGERGLAVAARTADVVGLAGLVQVAGAAPGTFTIADACLTDERAALVHRTAQDAGRAPELDVLLQWVVLDADPRESAEHLATEAAGDGHDWLTADLLLDSPFLLLAATPEAAVEELRRRSQRWGVRCWSTHAHSADALARVVAAARP